MKILSADQAQNLDQYTIKHEPIASIALMERASQRMVDWIVNHLPENQSYLIFAGPGNNGGDALALSRLLFETSHPATIQVVTCFYDNSISEDCELNYQRLQLQSGIKVLRAEDLNTLPEVDYIIDGIFGIGLSRPVQNPYEAIIQHINHAQSKVIAIDIPSGLFADKQSIGIAVKADVTLTIGCPNLALFLPESFESVGEWHYIDIGLHKEGIREAKTTYFTIDTHVAKGLYRPKKKFDHKGSNGKGMLLCGSEDMTGAVILAARAALRSGIGKLYIHSVKAAIDSCRILLPEAIFHVDKSPEAITAIDVNPKEMNALGIGCGIGTYNSNNWINKILLKAQYPVVLDADALNIISQYPKMLRSIPAQSILTPHPKEFQRLFGETVDSFDRLDGLRTMATTHNIHIILKGAHTAVALSNGDIYFNLTGNPGMATAGSGDVLTGILTALLAQGYPSQDAALLGTYVHGLAGDIALEQLGSHEGLIASDIIESLPQAFGVFYK